MGCFLEVNGLRDAAVSWCPFGGRRCVLGCRLLLRILTRHREAEPVRAGNSQHSRHSRPWQERGQCRSSQGYCHRIRAGRERQGRALWRPQAGPYRRWLRGGTGSGEQETLLHKLYSHSCFRGSQRRVCSPVLVWALWPPHHPRLGAIGTHPDQGGGSWSVMLLPVVPARLGRPEHMEPEGGDPAGCSGAVGQGSPSMFRARRRAPTPEGQPASGAGPGRPWSAGRRGLVFQDGMCRMWGGHLATPHNVSRPCPPPWALSFPLINWEQQWVCGCLTREQPGPSSQVAASGTPGGPGTPQTLPGTTRNPSGPQGALRDHGCIIWGKMEMLR